jgi:signal transduction histidine kinase
VSKRALAWTIFAIDIASLVVAGWFAWATRNASLSGGAGWSGTSFVEGALFALAVLPFPIVGLLIALRRPENAIGWLLLAIGFAWYFGEALAGYGTYGLAISPLPAAEWVLAFTNPLWVPPIGLMGTFTLLLFPDGHLPSPRWRWFAWLCGAVLVLTSLGILFGTKTLAEVGFPDLGNPWATPALTFLQVAIVLFPFCIIGSAGSLVVRYRRASGTERDQLKLLAFAAATVAVSYLLVMILSLGSGETDVTPTWLGVLQTLVVFSFALIPISIGVAILRHGLYDLDIVIKKTAMALVLTLLIGVPALLLLAAASVPWLIWSVPNSAFTLVGGVLLGLLAIPLVRTARRVANRIVYGTRATSYEVLTEFSERMGDAYSAEDVLPRMAQVLGTGLGADAAAVWFLAGNELEPAAVWPDEAEPPTEHLVDVSDRGERLGALSVAMPASEPLSGSAERLINDLASQAGLVLRNVRLIEELRASRRRLVAAQDEERRKIERNLHDGAQQQLVALAVQLKLARSVLDRDPAKAGDMLDSLQGAATDALEDLRDLARGIYPPLLADKGLPAAIEAQARKATIPVTVATDGIGRFSPDVESAVYFSCLEALQNVAKYANATTAAVALSDGSGELRFEVRDDGDGFDPSSTGYGTGLRGIADRLAALGGELVVTSAPGDGTAVAGRLPVEVRG